MPKITSIEPQKKRVERFNIFVDGKFAFGVSGQILLENNLKSGKLLTDSDITKILAREQIAKLTDLATNFLSYRPRSEKEVSDYLIKKLAVYENIKFAQASQSPLLEKVIEKLKKYKYINDVEFASWFTQSRNRSRPKGSMQIMAELRQKGISQEIIENTLKSSPNEVDLAKAALSKKVERWQNLGESQFKKKVYQFLTSRGFGFETIREVFAILKNLR
ncbi:MAG: RecX family transcriptional regulator [Candidatus Curtissbacteria bacterium]|nr:RecX family transcriptional regulator [Candidatus Curtissbacteria bacterium]